MNKSGQKVLALGLAVAAVVFLWPRQLVWVRSSVNGKEYRVKPLPDRVDAADRLAQLETRLRQFLEAAQRIAPGDRRLVNVQERWNGTLAETPGGKDIAYSIGKDSVYVCVRDASGALDDVNTCMFILVHELAHLATDDWGHVPQFWTNMKFMLELAEKTGAYTYQDFDAGLVTYCGRPLGGSPLACIKNGTTMFSYATSQNPAVSVMYAVVGIILGRATDVLCKHTVTTRSPHLGALFRLCIAALVLAGVHRSGSFQASWQGTTPGLFFVTMFFGTQSGLMADITRINEM